MRLLLRALPALLGAALAFPQEINVTRLVRDVAQQAEKATQYAFEGDLVLIGQHGSGPFSPLAQARVRVAAGPGGKSLVEVTDSAQGEYLLVSDGQKSWAYVPRLKQYTEEESSASAAEDGNDSDTGSSEERGLAESYARQVIPILARMYKTAASAAPAGQAEVRFGKKKQKWPVLRVFSRQDPKDGGSMTELALDPASLHIGRLVWANLTYHGGEKTLMRLTLDFRSFQIGEPPPADTFTFTPPRNAKLVDAVPIPGQSGSFLLNRPAPDFELKTIDGQRIRLEDLRGKPVLLTFFASWCGPCREELPSVVKLQQEFKDTGLQVFGVNDEGRGTARHFAEKAGIPFAVLDDSGEKVHRLYRVYNIPMTFLIDQNGKVVRYLRGGRDYAALRSALKAVGM